MELFLPVAMTSMFLLVVAFWISRGWTLRILREQHPALWKELGSPSFGLSDRANTNLLLTLIWSQEKYRAADLHLRQAIWTERAIFSLAVTLFVGIAVFII